jgi:glycerol-3-phosphate acyltransferase PlsY
MAGLMFWLEQLLGPQALWNRVLLVCSGAYGVGCLAGGYYLVRFRTGKDMRTIGSGSVGARNVSGVLGASGFLATLAFDILKGCLVVWAARKVTGDAHAAALAMLAVVAGHIWPLQLGFHGGKGVATSLGCLLIYDWKLLIAYGLIFLAPFAVMRRTVLPGLLAYACLPLASMFLQHEPMKVVMVATMAALVLIAHRRNFVEEFEALGGHTEADTKPEHPKP